ncbi:unnamed protein product, partial [marine sediment metagenome]
TQIFVMNYALWEAIPQERLLPGRFLVEVGNDVKQSRIIASREEAQDIADVIEVPDNYRRTFESDIDGALKDLGGVVTGTRRPFIPYKEQMAASQENYTKATGGLSLFKEEEIAMTDFFVGAPDWWELVSKEYIEDVIINRYQIFAVHIDVGVSEDALGIAVGRIIGYKALQSTQVYNKKRGSFVEMQDITGPIYMIDGVLRV